MSAQVALKIKTSTQKKSELSFGEDGCYEYIYLIGSDSGKCDCLPCNCSAAGAQTGILGSYGAGLAR